MKYRAAAAVWILPIALASTAEPPAPEPRVIVPGVRVGPLTKETSERDLAELYGRGNVVPSDIPIGEGESAPGTLLFPDEPTKRLEIIWTDKSRRGAREIRLRNEGTLWKTDKGITIGTELKEIERINRRPFVLTGFDWDYGGTVLHCNGGALGEVGRETESGSSGRTLILRLAPRGVPQGDPDYAKVNGDRAFSSGHPSMQKLNPVVYEMIVALDGN